MKRRILSLSFLFLFLFIAPASPEPSGQHCFLWEVRAGQTVVYILGSIHIFKNELYPLDPRIEEAFNNADTLVVEADINQASLLTNVSVLEKAVYQEGDSLERHLSQQAYESINQRCAPLGLDLSLFGQFKPWFVAMQVTVMSYLQLGYDPTSGIDLYFLNKASAKKIEELESVEYQINMLDSMSDRNQEYFLLSSLKDIDSQEAEMNAYIQAWLAGDLVSLEDSLFQKLREQPEIAGMYEALLFERNRDMVSKIEGYLRNSGTYFVVVGAGHLAGEKGILKLLQQKGYSVRQI
ncbi:MAG: TraB/GumN family protein [Candidatus Omnitrophota bacterium]|jgi:hypothetical protein